MTKESRKVQAAGLKDHQIAALALAVAESLRVYYRTIPEFAANQQIREIVSLSMVGWLNRNALRIDSRKSEN